VATTLWAYDQLRAKGRAVQVDPMKPKLKAPGSKRSKLIHDGPLLNFAFKFNLRR
jgi:hypothetical protein